MIVRLGELVLRAVTIIGLAIDAIIHFHLAPSQPPGASGQLSQVFLFNAEGIVSAAAAVLLLVWATRWSYLIAVVVAGSALAAVLVSRYADIGAIAFVPDLYEPMWYTSKVEAIIAEAVALVTALAGSLLLASGHSRPAVLVRRHQAAVAH